MKTNIKKFNSITEFANWQQGAPIMDSYKCDQSSQKTDDPSWIGTQTWDEAQALMLYGDPKLAKKIADGVVVAKKRIFATRPRARMVQAVGGFMPNISAYLSGAKKDMWRIKKQPVRQRVITIVYNSSIHCGTTTADAIETSVSLLKAVMIIESTGVRVNLYNSHFTSVAVNPTRRDLIVGELIKIKDSGQYLDTTKMAYPMIHPSMHRRQHFRTIEALDGDGKLRCGYGFPVRDGKVVRDVATDLNMRGSYCVAYYDIEGKTPEQIVDIIYDSKVQ